MEFLEGIDLFKIIDQKRNLKIGKILFILDNILNALEYIHGNGFIHRDIKPQNIMVCNPASIKLMDFGLVVADGSLNSKMERFRSGTPYYMSPEQIRGSKIDHRSDIYSMGVTLFHLITGETPFQRKDVFFQHLFEPVPSIEKFRKDVPRELIIITERCMAKKPEERYQRVKEIIDELKKIKPRLYNSNKSKGLLVSDLDKRRRKKDGVAGEVQMETEKIKK